MTPACRDDLNHRDGGRNEARAEKSHLGVLFDRYEHSFFQFDVLCCEKVQVCFCLLFGFTFLDSVNLWTERGGHSLDKRTYQCTERNPLPAAPCNIFMKFTSDSMWLLIILQNTVFSTGDKCIFKCFCYLVKTLNGARAV